MTFKTFLKKTKIYLTHFDQFYFSNLSYSFSSSGNLHIFYEQKLVRLIDKSCLPLFYTEITNNFFNNLSVLNMYDEHLLSVKNGFAQKKCYSEETYYFVLLSDKISKLGKRVFSDILNILLMSKMFLETTKGLILQNLLEIDQFYLANGHILTHMTDVEVCDTKDLNCVKISHLEIQQDEFQAYSVGFKRNYCYMFSVKKEKCPFDHDEVKLQYNLRIKTPNWKATCQDYFYMKPIQAQKLVESRLRIAKTKNAEENELNSYYNVFGVRTMGYNNTGEELIDLEDGSEEF